MKKIFFVLLTLVIALSLTLSMALPVAAFNYQEIPLVAGQNQVIGYVSVSNDASNLDVVFHITNSSWQLIETHLAVVTDPANFPQTNNGSPKVGKFQYSDSDGNYTIPLGSWNPGTQLYIAAHAVVRLSGSCGTETAWGLGQTCKGTYSIPFGGGSWAEYFPYTVE